MVVDKFYLVIDDLEMLVANKILHVDLEIRPHVHLHHRLLEPRWAATSVLRELYHLI
jgi:hypothetical protein